MGKLKLNFDGMRQRCGLLDRSLRNIGRWGTGFEDLRFGRI